MEEHANNYNNALSPDSLAKRTPSLRDVGINGHHTRLPLMILSPFSRGRGYNNVKIFVDLSESDTDISFVSSDRPRTDKISTDRISGVLFDSIDSCRTLRVSTSSESSFGSMRSEAKGSELSSFTDFSSSSIESEDAAAEMRRLKLELQRTMEMYSTACKAALTAEQKAMKLHRWRKDEERRLEEARLAEESARLTAERGRAKYKVAMENAQAAQRVAEIESRRRVSAIEASNDEEKTLSLSSLRYRRYSIDEIEEATKSFSKSRKVGEGGYGPVYKCYLDHTPVAVKVLRPDAAHGRSQFYKEVTVRTKFERRPNCRGGFSKRLSEAQPPQNRNIQWRIVYKWQEGSFSAAESETQSPSN
ncbi:hypothetical protein OROGR_016194 [Orobanche gracilis]